MEQLRQLLVSWDLKPVHVALLWNYLYIALADSLDAMPDLPPKLRARLKAATPISGSFRPRLKRTPADGFTRKYLLSSPTAKRLRLSRCASLAA